MAASLYSYEIYFFYFMFILTSLRCKTVDFIVYFTCIMKEGYFSFINK